MVIISNGPRGFEEEPDDAALEGWEARGAGLAFPDGEGAVAEAVESAAGPGVALLVAGDLGEPVGAAGGRDAVTAGGGAE